MKNQKRSMILLFLLMILALSGCISSSVKTDEIVEDGDTKGLDKEGIMKLNINVKEFNIAMEQVIGMNEVNN